MKFHADASKVRQVIVAYREYSNEHMYAIGYGPDWRQKIKRDALAFIMNGTVPFYMNREFRSSRMFANAR